MPKYRYEYPPLEPHFIEAPNAQAAVKYIRRTFPHNYDQILASLVEIPRWPDFWKTIDETGRVIPQRDSSD